MRLRLLRQFIFVLIFALLGSAVLLPSQAVEAQSGCAWTHTFNFTSSNGSWTNFDTGTYTTSVGWEDTYAVISGAGYRGVNIRIDMGASQTLTSFSTSYIASLGGLQGTPSNARNISLRREVNSVGGNLTTVNNPNSTSTISWTGTLANVNRVIIVSTVGYDSTGPITDQGGSMTYTAATVEGIGVTNPFTGGPACPPVASFTADPTLGIAPLEVEFTDTSTNTPTSWAWDFGDGDTSTSQNPTHTYDSEGIYEVTLTATNANGSSYVTDTIIVSSGIGTPGSGLLYEPIAPADAYTLAFGDGIFSVDSDYPEGGVNPFPWPYDHTVSVISISPGANVFAVADGTVQSVEPLGLFDCPGMDVSLSGGCMLASNETVLDMANYSLDQLALYQVDVTYLSGQHLSYYVNEAPTYVYEGLEISAGCIIGKTGEAINLTGGVGAAFVELIDEDTSDQLELIDALVVEPEESNACNVDPEFADCLSFDPQFLTPEQWTLNDPTKVQFATGGVEIQPGGLMTYSGMPLDETTAYRFSVLVEVIGSVGGTSGSGRIQLRLGESSVTHIVQSGNAQTKSVELAMHEPDEGSTYSAGIANVGSRALLVHWNCISENGDTGPQSQCYFLNYTFDDRLNDWATYGTVSVPPSTGEVLAADDAAIGQNVYLYPDTEEAHQYTFVLDWAWYVSGGDPTSDEPTVDFEYRFNSDPYDDFGSSVEYRELDYSLSERTTQVIEVSDAIDGEFRLHVDIDPSGFGGTLNILLRELCIYDDFTHHPKGGGTTPGGVVPVGNDPGMCAAIPRPDISSAVNVGAWINYLWLRLRNFFYCNLEPILEKIAVISNDTLQLVRWQIMYWQASADRLVHWMGYSVVPWLGGHFTNMAFGRQTTVIEEAEGCNNLFCLLQSLIEEIFAPLIDLIVTYATQMLDLLYRLLNMALDLLGTLASALIRLVVEVINLITQLATFVRLYLFAFVQSITNAQPVPMDGLPNCTEDPQSTSWCMAFYGLDKTVLANEGQLIIPIFIAVLAVTQLVWLAGKIGDLVDKIGGNL